MAANVTWAKTDSGNVLDTAGSTVGTADGAGVVTINATTHVHVGDSAGSGNFTLTINEGVTVKFADGTSRFRINAHAGSSTYGTLKVNGGSDGVIFTSAAGTPAAGDWEGIVFSGNTQAASPALYQRLEMDNVTIEYCSNCIASQLGGGLVAHSVIARGCTFQHWATSGVIHGGGYGFNTAGDVGATAWHFTACLFLNDTDNPAGIPVNATTGGIPTTNERVNLNFEHCSFLIVQDSTGPETIFRITDNSAVHARNCVFRGFNDGSGAMHLVWMSSPGLAVGFDFNFSSTDGALSHPSGTSFTIGDDGQNVDPAYTDETFPTVNLSPDAQAGSPDLFIADEFGGWPGAVEPHNNPTPGEGEFPIDATGTTGVWAGRKQRVYECSFGDDASKTLGRAIRVGVTASDGIGTKLIGGIFLKVNPERLK